MGLETPYSFFIQLTVSINFLASNKGLLSLMSFDAAHVLIWSLSLCNQRKQIPKVANFMELRVLLMTCVIFQGRL